ncbi:flagellar biosynthesis protein FlhF [Gilvimarinus xylanilyticus]|uniref:Flagellar biosynthesis protein FlhF n=1 Tax=Gilvimarinus xylanilyticus TaxID=2944139 RepID=A0A9X2HTS1_9GAMM|nr:flagellar biosynthesis protein FlhF [Gilvimarinus xylanilyticus]MCP8898338.1 flagellar biosynthesis protein FlhF [Gilvimarinus xylanilyticus]
MQVKRFVAKDMRRALEMVRQALGEEAIIHSSRRVKEGVELITSLASSQPALADPSPVPQAPPQQTSDDDLPAPKAPAKSGRDIAADIELATRRLEAKRLAEASADEYLQDNQVVNAGIKMQSAQGEATAPQSAAERYGLVSPSAPAESANAGDELEALHEEIAQMRLMLEQQLGRLGAAPTGPGNRQASALAQRLQKLGLSEQTAQALLQQPLKQRALAKAWPEVMARLAHAIPACKTDLTAQGGVFALVGPTGAGKTTTLAKLAARYVMAHGADKVALVTTDTQRLGGQEQLRSIARILQVPLRTVDENNSLSAVLRSLRKCPLVLIDTAGMRAGDPALNQKMLELANISRVQSLLVLPANSQPQVLKAALHSYQKADLAGCILSKLDDCASLGEAIDCALQARLPIAYTTDGQDVPDDIALARGHALVSKAAQMAQSARGQHNAQRSQA